MYTDAHELLEMIAARKFGIGTSGGQHDTLQRGRRGRPTGHISRSGFVLTLPMYLP